MKTRKNKKGISLIVLVITIIVMIILAAAIIISISNSGIINRANSAVEETNEKQMKELVSLAWAEAYLKETTVTKDDAYFYDEVIAYLKANGITDEELAKYEITADKNGADANLKTAVLNEYGFYFDELYVGTMEENETGFTEVAMVMHKNGSGEGLVKVAEMGGEYFPMMTYDKGELIYSKDTISIAGGDTSTATISNNGMKLEGEFSGLDISATCKFGQYRGVYYNREYIADYTGTFESQAVEAKYTLIVNENLTAVMYAETTINGVKQEDQQITFKIVDIIANGHICNIVDSTIENPTAEDKMEAIISASGKTIAIQGPDDTPIIFNLGGSSSGTGNNNQPENIETSHNGTIPEGGVYYVGVTSTDVGDYTGATATYTSGQAFPSTVNDGDVYVYGDYEYRYNQGWFFQWANIDELASIDITDGWGVAAIDRTKTTYGEVIANINNKPTTSMLCTFIASQITTTENINIPSKVETITCIFWGCGELADASSLVIPANIIKMDSAFYNCSTLANLPDMSKCLNVTDAASMFYGCSTLATAPDLSGFAKLTNISGMFEGCSNLINGPSVIPANVTDMTYAFKSCSSMTNTPDISNCKNLENLYGAFDCCESMTKLPNLSNCTKVTDMSIAFAYCKAATSYLGSTDAEGDFSNYVIPDSVTSLNCAFSNCINMVKAPNISNCTVLEDMHSTFEECANLVTGPTTIPSSVNQMYNTFENCSSLTGTININANPEKYSGCFVGTVKSIKIAGSCSSTTKANLAGTAKNGNVTY